MLHMCVNHVMKFLPAIRVDFTKLIYGVRLFFEVLIFHRIDSMVSEGRL